MQKRRSHRQHRNSEHSNVLRIASVNNKIIIYLGLTAIGSLARETNNFTENILIKILIYCEFQRIGKIG